MTSETKHWNIDCNSCKQNTTLYYFSSIEKHKKFIFTLPIYCPTKQCTSIKFLTNKPGLTYPKSVLILILSDFPIYTAILSSYLNSRIASTSIIIYGTSIYVAFHF